MGWGFGCLVGVWNPILWPLCLPMSATEFESIVKLRYIYSRLLVSGFSLSLVGTQKVLKSNNVADGWNKL